jgi:hypothetical protein
MNMKNILTRTLTIIGIGTSAINLFAQTAPTVTVEATMAPNAFGSPSYDAWVANGIYAAENGLTTYGAAGPTQFSVDNATLPVAANMVTGYNSWEGNATPAAPYDGEYGTRASFVAIINGNGQKIDMNGFGVTLTSSDPGDALGVSWPKNSILPNDWTYDSGDIGLIFDNGHDISGGFTVVDSGSPDQLVDEIISIGAGDAYDSYTASEGGDDPNLGDSNQQILNYDDSGIAPYSLTGTFDYNGIDGSATANFAPDASSTYLMLGGSFGALAYLRRRFNRA